jgi:hypothetical protein
MSRCLAARASFIQSSASCNHAISSSGLSYFCLPEAFYGFVEESICVALAHRVDPMALFGRL